MTALEGGGRFLGQLCGQNWLYSLFGFSKFKSFSSDMPLEKDFFLVTPVPRASCKSSITTGLFLGGQVNVSFQGGGFSRRCETGVLRTGPTAKTQRVVLRQSEQG
jgi:hypothetical protein